MQHSFQQVLGGSVSSLFSALKSCPCPHTLAGGVEPALAAIVLWLLHTLPLPLLPLSFDVQGRALETVAALEALVAHWITQYNLSISSQLISNLSSTCSLIPLCPGNSIFTDSQGEDVDLSVVGGHDSAYYRYLNCLD